MVNAECILLAVRGRYYYGESLTKFIQIQEWEYDRIVKCPQHFYFSTALKKHVDWCEARRKGTTLSFSEVVEVSAAERVPFAKLPRKVVPAVAASQSAPALRKPVHLRIRIRKLLGRTFGLAWRVYDRCILHPHDVFIIWLAESMRAWSEAKTVAQAFEQPPTPAQRALYINRNID